MSNPKLNVMVTGANGFIGNHLCNALSKLDYILNLHKVDIPSDITKRYIVNKWISSCKPDVIFHLAAKTQVTPHEREMAHATVKTNVIGTEILLEEAPQNCRFILASSVHCQDRAPSVYAASKIAAESLVDAYTNLKLVNGVTLRLTSCVGKNMTHGVVKDFMRKLRSKDKVLEVIGEEPGSLRPYVHVYDVVAAFIDFGLGAYKTEKGTHYVSTTEPLYVKDIADIIMKAMDIHKPLIWTGKELGDIDIIRPKITWWYNKYCTSEEAIIQAVKENL